MNVSAFALGLILLGLVNADVSHLRQNPQQRHMFVANNGQVVKQSFNLDGDATYSSPTYDSTGNKQRYWWMNTETFPLAKSQHSAPQNNYFTSGCSGCSSRAVNLQHNTQHFPKQNTYTHNPFTNVKLNPSFNRIQSTPILGSPQDANKFFSHQKFESGRIKHSSLCEDAGAACVAPKFCFNGFIDQSVEHKASRSSSGRCFAPEVCCKFTERKSAPLTQNHDSFVSAAESTSEVLTKEGYVVRKPSNQYLPGLPEYNQQPSNDQQSFIRPTQRPAPPPRTQPPVVYQPQQTVNRPVEYAPIVIPVGCSAAMNCTDVQYCTATGVISRSPVSLSPLQEMFRVPMTDCRNPSTNQVGKCCRDPDYTDPWPVGRTGQYVPEELNAAFDSGAYKQEPSAQVPVRVRAQEGYVIPQPSNTQQRLYLPPNSNRV